MDDSLVLPLWHLASKNTFSESTSDLVCESEVRWGSIATLELHELYHGVAGIAVVAVGEDNGEGRQSARDISESGGGVDGGYDFHHTFRGVCFFWDGMPFSVGPLRRVGTGRNGLQ